MSDNYKSPTGKGGPEKLIEKINFNRDWINLQAQLRFIKRQIHQLPEYINRAKWMGEKFEAKRYLEKLEKQKKELITQLGKTPAPGLKNGWARVQRGSPLYRPRISSGFKRRFPTDLHSDIGRASEVQTIIKPRYGDACPSYAGRVMPYYWEIMDEQHYIDENDLLNLEYNDSRFESHGDIDITSLLLTIDDYDRYFIYANIYWELPVPRCDVHIECQVDVSHSFNFAYAPENIGEACFSSLFVITHSGADGIFQTDDNSDYEWDNIFVEEFRPQVGPNISNVTLGFNASKGATYRVHLNHEIMLDAEKGAVMLNGTLGTHNIYGSGTGRPLLNYVMEEV